MVLFFLLSKKKRKQPINEQISCQSLFFRKKTDFDRFLPPKGTKKCKIRFATVAVCYCDAAKCNMLHNDTISIASVRRDCERDEEKCKVKNSINISRKDAETQSSPTAFSLQAISVISYDLCNYKILLYSFLLCVLASLRAICISHV